ncbi:vWA domain-containing protein [Jidongwangia harbinensis]|uniref:vWA domain-containing protein n=1 Tax=Jidongwangia harbinensis TaxID=2878561 RepID=UPI001CD9EC73|nr:vWA domain-containing protein [Jidongwangia harbinensis]MCA2216064.1 VWA domain-containing protein [Jidongwangia harbinensis]
MNIVVRRVAVAVGAATALVIGATVPAVAADPGVEPAAVAKAADPGAVIAIDKVVHTPTIPPKPDVVLLVDTTGSMGGAIANVRANLQTVIASVRSSQPSAQFAVASYRDTTDGAELFRVRQDLTADETAVQVAVDSLDADGGGDTPEAWINGLFQVSTGAITYRPGSSRIVVVVGDAPSHNPSAGHTLAEAIGALDVADTRVIAVNVADLDGEGQASEVVEATGGSLVPTDADGVSAAILTGLRNLDVTVIHKVSCDAGLTATLNPAELTVQSGNDAEFIETLTVAADATQGATLHCTVDFLLNGELAGPQFTQQVAVKVNDVTPPVASCVPGPNPAGHLPASANPDGFYTIGSTDVVDAAVDVFVRDTASSAVFGPYPSTTNIKLVQAPGATPGVVPGSGAVDYKITLKGDALIVGVDDAKNTSAGVACVVPPKKK